MHHTRPQSSSTRSSGTSHRLYCVPCLKFPVASLYYLPWISTFGAWKLYFFCRRTNSVEFTTKWFSCWHSQRVRCGRTIMPIYVRKSVSVVQTRTDGTVACRDEGWPQTGGSSGSHTESSLLIIAKYLSPLSQSFIFPNKISKSSMFQWSWSDAAMTSFTRRFGCIYKRAWIRDIIRSFTTH